MPTDRTDPVQITLGRDGPYVVTGPIAISDHDDTPIRVEPDATVALCRCGQSDNKPFCDGTHTTIGFDGTVHPSHRSAPANPVQPASVPSASTEGDRHDE